MPIADNIRATRSTLPNGVDLVAVSKFHPAEAIMQAYDAGQRIFGESRANELATKAATLPSDIEWHFIGHLQTNKVRSVVRHAAVIQSVDSQRLLDVIEAECARTDRRIKVLLQLHVALEETKFGFSPDELLGMAHNLSGQYPHIIFAGVMGMASNTDDMQRVADDFNAIRGTFDALATGPFAKEPAFRTVSMGMSHDYRLAMECGSNMVRIGTDIFGDREY